MLSSQRVSKLGMLMLRVRVDAIIPPNLDGFDDLYFLLVLLNVLRDFFDSFEMSLDVLFGVDD